MKVMDSLRLKIIALSHHGKGLNKLERGSTANHLLSMVDRTKKDLNMSSWIHMPHDSEEYQYYKSLCVNYEAFAYDTLGNLLLRDISEKGFNMRITHFKKARAICNLFGMTDAVKHVDTMILLQTNKQGEIDQNISTKAANTVLQNLKNSYEHELNTNGMNSEFTIVIGISYVSLLWDLSYHLEAERIIIKVATASRQVHGPHHKHTIDAYELRAKCTVRCVVDVDNNKLFQAIRYENDGEICLVTGPVADERIIEDERIYHIASNLVIPRKGCAVICHGLVSASHLNGELGEVRYMKQDETGIRLGVNFEKKGVKSALVKPCNLRIAFELPICSEE
jgi:hypothetical protein